MEIKTLLPDKFPLLLRQLKSIPKQLYHIGDIPSDDYKFLCVIGSRRYSSYGEEVCTHLIEGLSGYPVVIVSGLAIGIDSIAHATAIRAGLKTLALPGSGLSKHALYPVRHRKLAEDIISSGNALLSPFSPEQIGTQWTFPVRNKLMAGISHAVLVIEARQGSGTLITADAAADFGRDILSVPGSIFSDLSYGPHMLLRNGAIPVTNSLDILEALGIQVRENAPTSYHVNLDTLDISKEKRKILEYLISKPSDASHLIDHTGIHISELNIHISELELSGLITQKSGLYYINKSIEPG